MKSLIRIFLILIGIFECGVVLSEEPIKETVSIENVFTGELVTVFSNSAGGYLYAYPAYAYRNDSRRQNFTLSYLDGGAISLEYEPYGSCITNYYTNRGVIDTACHTSYRDQRWKILPVSTGAVQIMNEFTGKCLSVADGGAYSDLKFVNCAAPGERIHAKDSWIISAPRGSGKAPDENPHP